MRILLAIDQSEYSKAALQAVIAQFRPEGSQVQVVHAVDWEASLHTASMFAQGSAAMRDLLAQRDELCRTGQTLVDEAASRLRAAGFDATAVSIPEGDPRTAILDAAGTWGAELIVLGSHGRTGLSRFMLGSVAESVLRHSPCSVEVVRMPASRAM